MAALLRIGLVNAAVAAVLACLVAIVARKVRRPALVHALWIVVLVKLITPPLFEVPIEVPFDVSAAAVLSEEGALYFLQTSGTWLARHAVAVVVWGWLLGSAGWFLLQAFTAYKFSQRLALATPAPHGIQCEADELAAAMGLVHRPPVMLVRDVISPMLWGVGRNTRLLFPVNLLTRLDPGARATLIAHELAHYRRGDHWVRAFELVVSGLFWWNPVVWWARKQIEIAEEQCCDAWVIEQFPDTPRWYAEALLETIDFLSEAALVLPPAAAGAGHIPFLRERLTAIMRGVSPQRMTQRAWGAVLLAAVVSLPWHPGLKSAHDRSSVAAAAVEPSSDDETEVTFPTGEVLARLDEISKVQDAEMTRFVIADPVAVQNDQEWATATSRDGRYSITRRGSDGVYLYNAITNERIDISAYRILTVAFSPDGERFATGGADRIVRLWSSSSGQELQTFHDHEAGVHSVVFLNNGTELISASSDGRLKRWDLEQGFRQSPATSPHTPANCLAASVDGRWLAIGTGSWMKGEGGKIVIWDLSTMDKFEEFHCDVPVGVLTFKADGKTLAAGDFHGRVTFWDILSGRRLGSTLPRFKNAVAAARFSRDTQALTAVDLNDIYHEPEYPIPAVVPWYFDRSAGRSQLGEPLARAASGVSGPSAVQQEHIDADRLQGIRRGIESLERELQPAQKAVSRGSASPFTN